MKNKNSEIIVYSTAWCSDCKRAKKFFGEQRISYKNIDIDENPEFVSVVEKINNGMRAVPTIVFPDGSIMTEPTNAELAEKLGLNTVAQRKFYDVIIIGGGTSGLTASIYLAREGLDTLVIERGALGGQVGVTQMMDNFPGFDQGISGAEFADRLGRQAKRFGVEVIQATEVSGISKEDTGYLCVSTRPRNNYGCKAVLFATGAHYRRLGVPGEDALIGSRVHFCGTCDGAFYKDKHVLVVGGGNSGFEEGLFLTKYANQVDIVEFMPEVKASKIIQDKVFSLPNMSVTVNHAIKELVVEGRNNLVGIKVEDRSTGEIKTWHHDGIFIFIGLLPNSDLLKGVVELDKMGFVVTDKTLMTAIPGLFAAGDVRSGSTKQAASAAGEGATAALMIRDYVRSIG
ncbi:MAG: pyridine nucleotide-disulfide oxidoreductase [Chloroflexi bacterium HGW-Chloroflexi-8]|nr:MAG: pyridine nucleotide-disulfide oxidoreductase [Chloroflexi bacterium HGW-Chloroflexi-8]